MKVLDAETQAHRQVLIISQLVKHKPDYKAVQTSNFIVGNDFVEELTSRNI